MTEDKTRNVEIASFENENELLIAGKRGSKKLTAHKKQVAWRREKTLMMLTQGATTYECASILKVSPSTSARDVRWLRKQAEQELKFHIKSLPHEYRMAYRGLSECLKYAWTSIISGEDPKNKTAILSLIASIYKQRIDMATNASIIQESLNFVEAAKKEILMNSLNQEKRGV